MYNSINAWKYSHALLEYKYFLNGVYNHMNVESIHPKSIRKMNLCPLANHFRYIFDKF